VRKSGSRKNKHSINKSNSMYLYSNGTTEGGTRPSKGAGTGKTTGKQNEQTDEFY